MSSQEPNADVKPHLHQDGKAGVSNQGVNPSTPTSTTPTATPTATATASHQEDKPAPKKLSILERIWKLTGLNPSLLVLMIRGALAPTLVIACFQARVFLDVITTLDYLSAIIALLSLAFRPRARFIPFILYSMLFVCFAAAAGLLHIQCAVSARLSTSSPSGSVIGTSGGLEAIAYNSSANAVSGIFMFVLIYIISIVRGYRHQLMLPAIHSLIFTLVICVYAPKLPDMEAGMAFVRKILIAFMIGYAFSIGVNLFIFPITCRTVANKQIAGVLKLISGAITTQSTYISAVSEVQKSVANGNDGSKDPHAKLAATTKALKGNMAAIGSLISKLKDEASYAKKEAGYGKIGPKEYSEVVSELVNIMLPVVGASTLIGIMENLSDQKQEPGLKQNPESEEIYAALRLLHTGDWNNLITTLKEPYDNLQTHLLQSITHIGLVLGVFPKPHKGGRKKGEDIESHGRSPSQPGDQDFAAGLKDALDSFQAHRDTALVRWCEAKNINLPQSYWDNPEQGFSLKDNPAIAQMAVHSHWQTELYVLLYTEYLLFSIGKSVLQMVEYVDRKYAEGKFAKNRLILPTIRQIRKLILKAISEDNSGNDTITDGDSSGMNVWIGDSLNKSKKDPEHLPPVTWYEKATSPLRRIPHVLASEQSAFAFRTTIATLSLGIINYLHQTERFFAEQRGIWAIIMVSLSMDNHAGRGIYGFILRCVGTMVATAASIATWYIGDHRAAAIIPIVFIILMLCMWYLLKHPTMATVPIICMATVLLTVGYELQDQKIQRELVEANEQKYYKIYLLAPYRLVLVIVGLATACFWTYVPYPVTTHATLRTEVGRVLYLLGNFYSCTHTTIYTRLSTGSLTAEGVQGNALYKLAKARQKVFNKVVTILASMRQNLSFTKWEPTFGGRFPVETYNELIESSQHILNYISLMMLCSEAFTSNHDHTVLTSPHVDVGGDPEKNDQSEWLRSFSKVASSARILDHDLTSRLCLLSASLNNKLPLPPYLRNAPAFDLARHINQTDPEILSVRHIREPCYAAFTVLEIASILVQQEVENVGELVKQLVGEVDFSFHVISTADLSRAHAEGQDTTLTIVRSLVGDDADSKAKANKQD